MSDRRACIVGVGETEYSRASGRSEVTLAVEAVLAALVDAGIAPAELQGIIPAGPSVRSEEIISSLGLPDVRFTATLQMGGATPVGCIGLAAAAIEGGLAETVVVYAGRNGRSGAKVSTRVAGLPNQRLRTQLEHPYGWSTPAQHYAMFCRRHMHEHGTTKEHLGLISVTMRANAQLNPRAMMYGRPMTRADYHASEMIADPYQMFDCCLETDGGAAFVLTTAERAREHTDVPVRVAAYGEGHPESPDDPVSRKNPLLIGLSYAAGPAFARAGITPADIDAAMIYDCFTFELLHQLEEAGFCERGGGGEFVKHKGIGLDGALPVNTHGGLMSEGHMLGINHVNEAIRQLRGECDARQLPDPQWIAVTGWGDFGDGTIALLTKEM
ncbi:MAG TPA: hypothetical protein VGG41_21330 [Solirubrobacteraceae bacterium]|jgi:acetyl-CoA acetyltransferase